MNGALYRARLVVFVCLLAVVLTALTPSAYGMLFAILVPIWFFFAVILSVLIYIAEQSTDPQDYQILGRLSPRPPPAH
jgi:hypothetical protein